MGRVPPDFLEDPPSQGRGRGAPHAPRGSGRRPPRGRRLSLGLGALTSIPSLWRRWAAGSGENFKGGREGGGPGPPGLGGARGHGDMTEIQRPGGSTEALGRPRLGAPSLGTVTGYPMVPVGDWFGREFQRRPEAGDPSSSLAVGLRKCSTFFSKELQARGSAEALGRPRFGARSPATLPSHPMVQVGDWLGREFQRREAGREPGSSLAVGLGKISDVFPKRSMILDPLAAQGRAPAKGPLSWLPYGTSWRLARERISKEGGREGAQELLGCGT